ncbi:hypothetical protein NZK35_00975 [Stieleria sp. ICT_E10.1]|uniref:hypothetical protein n=1 Tax=Stieleria sedimenti TaxID=2976331 RepID=UPI0021805EBE|nr:hypothetical protein [Stieleria sedimenti]MCS7465241.1 hypothetical protein [Stieleria sedimenti]
MAGYMAGSVADDSLRRLFATAVASSSVVTSIAPGETDLLGVADAIRSGVGKIGTIFGPEGADSDANDQCDHETC